MGGGLPNKKVKKQFLDRDIAEGKQRTLNKNDCECGHSRNLHTWGYAEGVEKVEVCKVCACQRFVETRKGEPHG